MLKFAVKGSRPEPYVVTFDGEPPNVRAYCTCPSGRRAGRFCKHVKFAIEGGPQLVRDASDSHDQLRGLLVGTELERYAEQYIPPMQKQGVGGCYSIFDIDRQYRRRLENQGYLVELVCDEGQFPSETLNVYRRFKNGNARKQPSFSLSREELAYDLVVSPDGTETRTNIRPRIRPYSLRSERRQTNSWSNIDLALSEFLIDVGLKV